VNPAVPSAPQNKAAGATIGSSGFDSDRATVSNAGNEVSQAVSGEDVRTEKVAAVQASLAAGSYNVAASAVASKLIDSMLGAGQ
jgi:negative regulator of flagellin synthesis FlgM